MTNNIRFFTRREVRNAAEKGRHAAKVKRLPNGATLFKVTYTWPCFNCFSPTKVPFHTFSALQGGAALTVKCGDCLTPDPNTMSRAA